MAASKDSTNLTHSQINAGDMLYELCCTPCTKKSLNQCASKYCVNCKQYFCVSCVENHNSFTSLSGHVLVDPNATKTSSKSIGQTFPTIPTELCKIHTLELVNMYCGDDDVVGCSVCFTIHHKSCTDTHYIPEYVRTFPAQQVDLISKKLTEAIKTMKKLKTQHDRLDENLDKRKDSCKREMQKHRDEINQIIDKIEAATLAELDAKHKDAKKNAKGVGQNIKKVHGEMIKFKSEIESDQTNYSQKFVIAKLSQYMIKQGQELQSELSHHQTSELKFTRNTDIITFLLSVITLGMVSPPLVQDSTSTTATSNKQQQHTKSTASQTASADIRQQVTKSALKPLKQRHYEINKSECNIQHPDDQGTCGIRSSCILDNGYILLVDVNNYKLKLVDIRTHTVTSSLLLNDRPFSVCRVSSTEAAVCLGNQTIQFVSTCDKLVPVRLLGIKHFCRSIAVISDKMYVCDINSVYIHTLNGKLVQTIREDETGDRIFSSIYDIAVSEDGMIHVADSNIGVVTLNTDGHVVWRYSGKEILEAWGVCTDGNGYVIVCGHKSNNVIRLAPDGQYMGRMVKYCDDVKYPCTVCYERNNHNLIVGNDANTIKCYSVK